MGRLVRLNTNGTLDTNYVTVITNGGSAVVTLGLQTNGQAVVGGTFTTAGTNQPQLPLNRIARFNTNGTVDTLFSPGTGPNGVLRALVIQSDQRAVIVGDFTAYNGTGNRNGIARLNLDGSVDGTFAPGGNARPAR